MTINCVWEHNCNDTLLYAVDYIGAYTRGESLEAAKAKMPSEIVSYLKWLGEAPAGNMEIVIVGEKAPELAIRDADSDVLFESEKSPLTAEEYEKLKALRFTVIRKYSQKLITNADRQGAKEAENPSLSKWSPLCFLYAFCYAVEWRF